MAVTTICSFRDLDTWHVAMELAVACYGAAKKLPPSERFELSAQIRRAATSGPANIAEGHATGRDGLCMRHLRIALGSVGELDTHFELAARLGLLTAADVKTVQAQAARSAQLLHGLLRSVRSRQRRNAATTSALLAAPLLWLALAVLG
jgi:four helix bundle protein